MRRTVGNERRSDLKQLDHAHLVCLAPEMVGKSADILVPMLLEFEGSCIVLDPESTLADITGRERQTLRKGVSIFNPFDAVLRARRKKAGLL